MDGLIKLPAEILAAITELIDAVSIFKLLLCGSTVINRKLTGPSGVTKIASGPYRLTTNLLWRVSFLFSNLKSFNLKSYMPLPKSGISLPSSLTSIEMCIPEAELAFEAFDFKTHLPNLLSLHLSGNSRWTNQTIELLPSGLKSLSLISNRHLNHKCTSKLPRELTCLQLPSNENLRPSSLGKLPPVLETLSFRWSQQMTTKPIPVSFRKLLITNLDIKCYAELSGADLRCFPTSITYMRIEGTVSEDVFEFAPLPLSTLYCGFSREATPRLIKAIPRTVKNLMLRDRITDPQAWKLLPPKLESFEAGWGSIPSISNIPLLPATLTRLEWDSSEFGAELIQYLPRGLKRFRVGKLDLTGESVLQLPPNLTHLVISGLPTSFPLRSFDGLPKTLQYSIIPSIILTDDCFEYLTKRYAHNQESPLHTTWNLANLVRFAWREMGIVPCPSRCTVTLKLTEHCLKYLPSTLTSLNMEVGANWTESSMEHLPRTLEHLSLPSIRTLTNSAFQFLPPRLKYLDISMSEIFSEEIIHYLPETLEYLKIGGIHFEGAIFAMMAANSRIIETDEITLESMIKVFQYETRFITIEFLTRSGFRDSISNDSAAIIPQYIKKLDILGINLLNSCIQLLPNLTELSLHRNVTLDNTALPLLPRTLTKLVLPWCTRFTDVGFIQLPPHLLWLDFQYMSNITDNAVRHLPRTITYLDLSGARLTDRSSPWLPPALQALYLSWSVYTDASIINLPRTLTTVDFGGSKRFHNVDANHLPLSLSHINWHWTLPMLQACKARLPYLIVPQTVLVMLGLTEIPWYFKCGIKY